MDPASSMRFVSVAANALQFHAQEWGPSAGPLVVCLHGFPQRATSWTGVAERLTDAGIRTIAVDQRGYSPGARPTDVTAYALPELVADATAVIEAIGGPVHLVGHDWGAVVGWQVAARRPDLLLTWTALSTPNPLALNDALATDPQQAQQFRYMAMFREPGVAEQNLLGNNAAGLAAVYAGRVPPERVSDDVAFFQQPGVLTAALNWYRAMERDDAAGLGPVTVPTAYVWGSEDQAFGRTAAEGSGRFVTAPYRFLPLDGAGHWLPDEAPDTVAEVIAEQVSVGGPGG